jgi:flagellar P-ring protein precursor FlgI
MMNQRIAKRWAPLLLVCSTAMLCGDEACGQYRLRVRDICRVKGQEENTLHGLGLVVGLNGTGDGDTPTIRALGKMMELMGNPVAQDARGQLMLE